MSDLPIPRDDAAENAVLTAALTTPGVFDRVSLCGLTSADFYQPRQRAVFAAIEEMQGAGVDPITVTKWLRENGDLENAGGVPFVSQLVAASIPDIARVERYAEIVKDCSNRRRFIADFERLRIETARGGDVTSLAQRTAVLCSEIALNGAKGPDTIRSIARRSVTRLEERMTASDPIGNNIAYPVRALNVITNGAPRCVANFVGARPQVGKTAFSIATTIGAVDTGKRVLLIELDMSETMIGDRFLASVAGVSATKVRTGRGLDEQELKAITGAAKRLAGWGDRLIVDTKSRNIAAITALMRREARSDAGLDLVIVDHIGHVRGGKGDARYLQIGDVSTLLIEAAGETNVALLNLAQLGRDAAQREPSLSDLRESGNLEQDARFVLLLDRPGLREASVPQCRLNIHVAKAEGEAGHTVEAHFDLRMQRITDEREAWCAYCSPTSQRYDGRSLAAEGRA